MNAELVAFEQLLARRSTQVCKILGMSYSSYAEYRSQARGRDKLPDYISLHIRTLKLLDSDALNDVIRERLANGD